MPGPGKEGEGERRIENMERGGEGGGGMKGDGREGAEKNEPGSEVEDGAGWKGKNRER